MRPYSVDLRQRVLAAVDAGELSRLEIAELFAVSTAWIRRLVQKRRETGSIAPNPPGHGPKPKLGPQDQQQLLVLVRQQPDATLEELCQRLPVPVSGVTVCRALKHLGLPRKKSRVPPASRTGPMSKRPARTSPSK